MKKNKIYIEFVGITNSGKTRLMQALKRRLRKEGLDVKTPYDYSKAEKLSSAVKIPGTIAMWTLKAFNTTRSIRGTARFMRKMTPALSMAASIRNQPDDVFIIDEGIMHKFRRLRKLSRKNVTFDEVAGGGEIDKLFPETPDMVVVTHVKPGVFRERQQKNDITIDRESAERQVGKMKRSVKDLDVLEEKKTEVVHADNNSPEELEAAVEKIVKRLPL